MRPLWRCGNCGHRFVTKNLWHSCGRHRLADHFKGKPRELRRIFNRFVALAKVCGPVTVYAQKTRIVVQARVRFGGVVVHGRRARDLDADGRMRPAGLAAFAARRENRSGIYSYEQRRAELPEPYAGMLRKNRAAWAFFEAQPPGFRKLVSWWVVSARKEETRLKRLKKLIEESARGKRVR